ncbi:MAG: sulfatase-like hydrolase/transferase [Steroidobacteraceae bacterium]
MQPRLIRIIALPISRSDLRRALALCGPLALLLAADKALKLTDVASGGFGAIVWHGLLHPAFESPLGGLALAVVVIGTLLVLLMTSRGVSARSWVGFGLSILLVYFALAIQAFLHGAARPLWSPVLSSAATDLLRLVGYWWRDAATLTLLAGLVAWHLARPARDRHLLCSTVVWSILALAYVLTALHIAFFAATRAPLDASDLYFALSSPHEAWLVSRGGLSMRSTIMLAQILLWAVACAVAVFLSTRGNTFLRSRSPHSRVERLGLALWPALALAVISPASGPQALAANDPLLSISVGDAEDTLAGMWALHERGTPSALVPTLQVQPIMLAPTAAARPWNVVIVMLESARARDTTVYTPSLNDTPFLAQLARESLVVDHAYAVIPRTTDAWIATLAGRYPSTDGIVGNWARHESPVIPSSMPRLLRARGYVSAFFLPTTLDFGEDVAVVQALGFDEVVTKESIPEPASGLVTPFGWEDRALLPPIGRWLDQRVLDKRPFLLTVMTNVGHTPYGLPSGYHMQRFPSLNTQHERYLNCMHYIDGYVHDLVQELRDRGLFDKTLFIVLGDHGETFGEHGSFLRAVGLHEELLQIPMIVSLPSVARRTGHIGGLRQQIDVLPTVADALGLELRGAALPGTSLLSDPRGHQALFFSQYWDKTALALRIGRLKYIYAFERSPLEVFDLSSDPMERRNIAAQLNSRDETQARVDMLAWRERAIQTFQAQTRDGAAPKLHPAGDLDEAQHPDAGD